MKLVHVVYIFCLLTALYNTGVAIHAYNQYEMALSILHIVFVVINLISAYAMYYIIKRSL